MWAQAANQMQFDPNKFWDHVLQAVTNIVIAFFTVGLPATFAYLNLRRGQRATQATLAQQNVESAQDRKQIMSLPKKIDAAADAASQAVIEKVESAKSEVVSEVSKSSPGRK